VGSRAERHQLRCLVLRVPGVIGVECHQPRHGMGGAMGDWLHVRRVHRLRVGGLAGHFFTSTSIFAISGRSAWSHLSHASAPIRSILLGPMHRLALATDIGCCLAQSCPAGLIYPLAPSGTARSRLPRSGGVSHCARACASCESISLSACRHSLPLSFSGARCWHVP